MSVQTKDPELLQLLLSKPAKPLQLLTQELGPSSCIAVCREFNTHISSASRLADSYFCWGSAQRALWYAVITSANTNNVSVLCPNTWVSSNYTPAAELIPSSWKWCVFVSSRKEDGF